MDDDNWDLSAVVRSCRPSGAAATTTSSSDTFSLLPPHSRPLLAAEGGKGGAFVLLPDVYQRRTSAPGLEELYNSSFLKGWLPRSTTTTSPLAAVGGSLQPPPCRRADRPVSRIHRSRRRKSQQKKVVCHVPADGLSSDTWAWRKYGQKPIKGDTTSVAALKRASRGSRWSGAGQTRGSTSSPTPASTTTPCPPIAAPSPGAHATSFQVLPTPPLPRGMAGNTPPPPTPKPVPSPRPPQLGCPPPPRSLPPWTTSLSAADQRKGKTAWTRRKRWKKKMTRACSWWRTWR
ncbi:WRKY transcription factor [Musa troglodytarum]|uniref:WRKY transcription factor n=1 Tax=Musa troglodytarum TaxID=320322 RepID=A0A9E7L4E5_9LILI|nr:WRKY transcription factor [Musa troglodytarum]